MTGDRRLVRGRSLRGWWAAALLLWACGDGGTGPRLPRVSTLTVVSGNAQTGIAGQVLNGPLVVRASDSKGSPIPGVTVNWSTAAGSLPATSVTDASGATAITWTLGTVAGTASASAAVGDKTAAFTALVTPDAIFTTRLEPAAITIDPGAERQLQLLATDQYGNAVTGRTPAWESTEPLIASVGATGLVRGVGGGTAQIRATLDTRVATAAVTVTGDPTPIPTITAITPDLLTPGIAATITGTNFAATPAANAVTINGAAATVTEATATQLRITVPGSAALGCTPTAPVPVVVRVGSARGERPHPVRTATSRALAPGEELHSTATTQLGCIELAAGSGRYLLAVYNVGAAFSGAGQNVVNNGPAVDVRTAVAAGTQPQPAAVLAPGTGQPALPSLSAQVAARWRAHLRAHEQVMERNRELMPRVRLPSPDRFEARASVVAAVPAVGDSVWIRFPDVAGSLNLACTSFDSVRARVAHVGDRAVVLEDVTAPLAGQVDSLYPRLAAQFDQVQYPLIRDNFGDPLLLDGQLNNDGRLYMLYTRKVNSLRDGGVLGFVWSGDFDDGTSCPQSNRAEIFYGIVPTQLTGGSGADWSVADWYQYTRSTVVHEVKHVASMAARFRNEATPFVADSMWLEESAAMLAEELWARQVFGYQQLGNTGFEESILCELNLAPSGCTGMPLVMLNHFAFLYDYYEGSASHSMLGRSTNDDATFYGSGWALLRWLTDHSGMPESQFLSALTQATTAGLTSIQAVLGRSWEDLLREYVLAMALDDRAGFTSPNARWSQPSWDTRDVFGGLSRLRTTGGGIPFPLEFPLVSRALAPPSASLTQVRPGGAAVFEFQVPGTSSQAFEVLGSNGAPLPPGIRVAVLRVQ